MLNKTEIIRNKIITSEALLHQAQGWRVKNDKIVFTNGCFDILHKGHIALLLQAAEVGNRVVVAINTDSSVKKLKGEGRPVNLQDDRALLLATQVYVDAVVLFDEDTPLELIKALKPDVLVKGGDYTEEAIIGADVVKANGGSILIVPLEKGYSTSALLNKS